jgi:hypothetical protein
LERINNFKVRKFVNSEEIICKYASHIPNNGEIIAASWVGRQVEK